MFRAVLMPDWLVAAQNALLDFLNTYQYLGLALYVGIEEAGVPFPVPADTAIVVMGYQVYRGEANPASVIAVVVGSATLGASILYWISRLVGVRIIRRFERFLRITPERHARAERWFARYQVPAVVIGRLIPGFRIVITVVAGVARGNFPLFVMSAALSALIWSLVFMSLGWAFGDQYERVLEAVRADPRLAAAVVGAIVILIAVGVWLWIRRRASRTSEFEPYGTADRDGTPPDVRG